MATLFFSYSHKDEALRNELEVHLSMLKREGLIDAWHDRRIEAGEDIHESINSALDSADIVLLLISAYFLASDYCFDIEMTHALEKHGAGTARVIPIILHPCDWHNSPFGGLRATPPDGKPVSMFANQDEALSLIARDVREAAETFSTSVEMTATSTMEVPRTARRELPERSSNLRVKKDFTDSDVDSFLEESFEYLARYFEASLHELEKRNANITTRYRRIDANSFTASIYNDGSRASECTIWMGGRDVFLGGIAYSSGITMSRNSYNESLSVENDGYSLNLRSFGMSSPGMQQEGKMSKEGAAEFYLEHAHARLTVAIHA